MIEINLALLITQVATFLAAMVVVWKLFWGPLTQMMRDRTQKIQGDLEHAEKGRREIEALEAEYHQRLSRIEEHARKEINDAIQKGNSAKEEILQEARAEAQNILEKTKRDLAQEREKVIREIRHQVSDLSLAAIERLLSHGVDTSVQKRLIDEFLDEVEKVEKVR